ncbi:MAG TPA: phytanoyl-CoA dioxygenase family protein [Caulobacteraceae bacterium]|jgi:ectoine hydroxylase-related dioxygenase (phytanoyl-CoA dioxygenase family)|nr:phytanoyl-CoA dioxygenase family protein [Caulobacteraceae bacterium]
MITRRHGNLILRKEPAPEASAQLEREGYAHLPAVLDAEATDALREEIAAVYAASGPDRERDAEGVWRYAMFNRSPLAQKAIGERAILDVIEPLLGEDCHIIANTAWRNPAGHQGGRWHMDAGPHIPRPADVTWPDEIPYPVFAIGMHLFLIDCPLEAGPTAVIPGSHRSGRLPPRDAHERDMDLDFEGRGPVLLPAKAGDAILFVSDIWHRGTPAQPEHGRFFLQCHYARRDIAQRNYPTIESNQISPEAIERAQSEREKRLIGLHPIFFYDG